MVAGTQRRGALHGEICRRLRRGPVAGGSVFRKHVAVFGQRILGGLPHRKETNYVVSGWNNCLGKYCNGHRCAGGVPAGSKHRPPGGKRHERPEGIVRCTVFLNSSKTWLLASG